MPQPSFYVLEFILAIIVFIMSRLMEGAATTHKE